MPETKLVPSVTTLTVIDSVIEILTEFFDGLCNTISAFLSDEVSNQDGVPYIEGELIIKMVNFPDQIDYDINNQGELTVTSPDANDYSIDNNGDLICTTP